MTKNELRKCFKKKQQSFVFYMKNSEILAIQARLIRQLDAAGIANGAIGGYAAMTAEFDPLPLLRHWENKGHAIALPYFETRSSEMQFRAWGDTLDRGPFGVMQPPSDAPIVTPETVLVPLVAVDHQGNRVGQGQGHFDRLLAKMRQNGPVRAIGLGWDCQIVERIPADPWDEPLNYIATPDRLLEITS